MLIVRRISRLCNFHNSLLAYFFLWFFRLFSPHPCHRVSDIIILTNTKVQRFGFSDDNLSDCLNHKQMKTRDVVEMLSMLTLHWHPFRHYWRARNTRKIDINTRNEFSNLAVLCRLRWNSGLFAFELCNIQSTSYYGYGRTHKFYDFHEILTQLPHIDLNNVENL